MWTSGKHFKTNFVTVFIILKVNIWFADTEFDTAQIHSMIFLLVLFDTKLIYGRYRRCFTSIFIYIIVINAEIKLHHLLKF